MAAQFSQPSPYPNPYGPAPPFDASAQQQYGVPFAAAQQYAGQFGQQPAYPQASPTASPRAPPYPTELLPDSPSSWIP